MTSRQFRDRLNRRARRSGVQLSSDLAGRLEVYFRLVSAWNEKVNLTALNLVEPAPEALDRLLVEPLAAVQHVPSVASRMLDIGTGCGSPAIPMALAAPFLQVLMVESKTRKSVFLREAVRKLELEERCEVINARFEELLSRPDLHESQDLLTVRAVRVEPRVLMGLQAFVRPSGLIFLFRNVGSGGLAEALHPPLAWRASYPLVEASGSQLVVLEKRSLDR